MFSYVLLVIVLRCVFLVEIHHLLVLVRAQCPLEGEAGFLVCSEVGALVDLRLQRFGYLVAVDVEDGPVVEVADDGAIIMVCLGVDVETDAVRAHIVAYRSGAVLLCILASFPLRAFLKALVAR